MKYNIPSIILWTEVNRMLKNLIVLKWQIAMLLETFNKHGFSVTSDSMCFTTCLPTKIIWGTPKLKSCKCNYCTVWTTTYNNGMFVTRQDFEISRSDTFYPCQNLIQLTIALLPLRNVWNTCTVFYQFSYSIYMVYCLFPLTFFL